jgi:hypothetical protein
VRFSSGEFLGVCSFKRAVFDFVRSEHQNANPNVIFEQIKFVKGVDFCQTDFKKSRVSFYEARFGISSNFECAGFGDGMEFFSSIVENFRDIIGSLNGERVFIGNAGNIFYNMESLGGT